MAVGGCVTPGGWLARAAKPLMHNDNTGLVNDKML